MSYGRADLIVSVLFHGSEMVVKFGEDVGGRAPSIRRLRSVSHGELWQSVIDLYYLTFLISISIGCSSHW